MVNVVGAKDDPARWKPPGYEDHFTVGEVATFVGRSKERIYKAEREKQIAAPIRVRIGRLRVRLYSKQERAKIKRYFDQVKPGPRQI